MRILILGGTIFLGRAMVDAAVAAGHEVTLFNRGKTNADLYPDLEKLIGDRDGGLDMLTDRKWNAVIDVAGYVPRIVRQSAEKLKDSVGHYVFVSTISVYASMAEVGMTEDAAVGRLEDESVEEVGNETYGPLKALCEQTVIDVFGEDRSLIVRPGLIVGQYDELDRFPYWVHRIAEGGRVLAPGRPERLVQIVDARDLAEFTIAGVEKSLAGTFQVTGPSKPVPMGNVLDACVRVSGSDAELVWADDAFLLENEVGVFMEMPLWIPELEESFAGFMRVDCSRAVAAGLAYRPLDETVQAVLEWVRTRPSDHEWRAGMRREREAELLQAWDSREAK